MAGFSKRTRPTKNSLPDIYQERSRLMEQVNRQWLARDAPGLLGDRPYLSRVERNEKAIRARERAGNLPSYPDEDTRAEQAYFRSLC